MILFIHPQNPPPIFLFLSPFPELSLLLLRLFPLLCYVDHCLSGNFNRTKPDNG
jgi:hypothetical protein